MNPQVGLLFVDFEHGHRLRVNGVASVDPDDPLPSDYPGAHVVVRVRTTLVYPNCKRYVHRLSRVERSTFVPRVGETTPVPTWKREEWVGADALPRDDPARDPSRPTAPATSRTTDPGGPGSAAGSRHVPAPPTWGTASA